MNQNKKERMESIFKKIKGEKKTGIKVVKTLKTETNG